MPDRPLIIPTADEREQEEREAVRIETTAMADAFIVLQPLGEEARFRAIKWLAAALDLPAPYRASRRAEQEVPF
jgi:hypothetical protein